MKKINKISWTLPVLASTFVLGLASFSLASCSDINEESSLVKVATNAIKDKNNKNTVATTEIYRGAFVLGSDAYTTLTIKPDFTYTLTGALDAGVTDDHGTWEYINSAARFVAQATRRLKSDTHTATNGEKGTVIVETSTSGISISEDTNASSKIEASGLGYNNNKTVFQTSTPVKVETDNLNLTDAEQNSILSFAAAEKTSEKKGIKITFNAPERHRNKNFQQIQIRYIDKKGQTSTVATYSFPNTNKTSAEFYFPFVDEDSFITFGATIEYEGPTSTPEKFGANYILNTISGTGAIENLPANYSNWSPCESSRFSVTGDTATINDTCATKILPKNVTFSSKSYQLAICYSRYNDLDKRWDDANWYDGIESSVSTISESYTCYFGGNNSYRGRSLRPDASVADGKGYYFYIFRFLYSIEGYRECTYETPNINSQIYTVQ